MMSGTMTFRLSGARWRGAWPLSNRESSNNSPTIAPMRLASSWIRPMKSTAVSLSSRAAVLEGLDEGEQRCDRAPQFVRDVGYEFTSGRVKLPCAGEIVEGEECARAPLIGSGVAMAEINR